MLKTYSVIRVLQSLLAISILIIDIIGGPAEIGFRNSPGKTDLTNAYGVHTVWCGFAAVLFMIGAFYLPERSDRNRKISFVTDLFIGFPLFVTSSMKAHHYFENLFVFCQMVDQRSRISFEFRNYEAFCNLLIPSFALGNFSSHY